VTRDAVTTADFRNGTAFWVAIVDTGVRIYRWRAIAGLHQLSPIWPAVSPRATHKGPPPRSLDKGGGKFAS